jgi:hypothetical protein
MLTVGDLRSAIDANVCFIGWLGPATECGGMRFDPLPVANYLCDLALTARPATAPVGAIHHYVWAMAFAQERPIAALALRNLASLLDGIIDLPKDDPEQA